MKNLILPSLFAILFVVSCDKIDDPYLGTGQSTGNGAAEVKRKILIEDYTGHTCGNCPGAAIVAGQLHDTYGDQVIIAAVHVGYFAIPYTPPQTHFLTDFRTPAGDEYDLEFGPLNLPTGLINRYRDPGSNKINHLSGTWGTLVAEMVDDEPAVQLTLSSAYNSSSRTVSVDINATGLVDLPGEYKVVLYLTESNIVDWQKNYTTGGDPSYPNPETGNYVHNHVLRDNINSTWGDVIFADGITIDDSQERNYTYTLDAAWDSGECHIIAYVYDSDTDEIIQVEEVSVE